MQLTAFCESAMSYCFADHKCKLLLAQQHAAMPSCMTKPEPITLVLMYTFCGRCSAEVVFTGQCQRCVLACGAGGCRHDGRVPASRQLCGAHHALCWRPSHSRLRQGGGHGAGPTHQVCRPAGTNAADNVSFASASDRTVDKAPPAASAQTPAQYIRKNNPALLAKLQWQMHLPTHSLLVVLLDLHAGQPL